MASQNSKVKTVHDQKVESLARNLKKQGFKVKADLADYDKPSAFAGLRPDIIAKKGDERRIYEVETEKSKDSSHGKKQEKEFKAVADRNPRTTYKKFIVK